MHLARSLTLAIEYFSRAFALRYVWVPFYYNNYTIEDYDIANKNSISTAHPESLTPFNMFSYPDNILIG